MNKEKSIVLGLTAVFAVVLIALIANWLNPSVASFGNSEFSTQRTDIYGSATNTTLASTTSKIVSIDPSFDKVNLNIKTTSTAAQTIAIVPEFSNENNCDTATYFRETLNAGNVIFVASDPTGLTQVTSTYSIGIPAGASYNNMQLTNLNARCIKLTLTTSSTTDPAIAWVEGLFSN
jgi:hypothetical protein